MISTTENAGGQVVSLADIEAAAREYSRAHASLRETVEELDAMIAAARNKLMPRIRRGVAEAAEKKAAAEALVDGARGLFVRPRTVIFHGVKVGLEKGKGKIEFADEERVIRLIRKNLPDQAESLVKAEEHVVKAALKNLTVAQLKGIGCEVDEAGDQVIVRVMDSEIDKAVRALLKAAEENGER